MLLVQAITHGQHHRGQHASRMRQLGIAPLMPDFRLLVRAWAAIDPTISAHINRSSDGAESHEPPGMDFIRSHMDVLAGVDFFTVEVLTWRGLITYYVLFFLEIGSRRVSLGTLPGTRTRAGRSRTKRDNGKDRIPEQVPPCFA